MIYKSINDTCFLIGFFEREILKYERNGDARGKFISEQQLEDCQMWLRTLEERDEA